MSKKTQNWAVPLIAVLLGMLIGAVLMLIFGYDPFWAYYDLFSTAFGSLKNIGEILRAMSPLILIALGFSVASKAGFFNVGLPGQALAGWTSAVWFALSLPCSTSLPCLINQQQGVFILMVWTQQPSKIRMLPVFVVKN